MTKERTDTSINDSVESKHNREDKFELPIKSLLDILVRAGVALAIEEGHVDTGGDE